MLLQERTRTNMDAVLEDLSKSPSSLEKLPSLGKEALAGRVAELTRIERELNKSLPLRGGEAKSFTEATVKEGKTGVVYDRTVGRIRRDTDFFKIYDELGLAQVINTGFQTKALGLSVRWDKTDLPEDWEAAHYYHRKTLVGSPKPKKEEILESLAESGRLPQGAEDYVHERTHELDAPKGVKTFIFGGEVYFELSEAHGYRVGNLPIDLYSAREAEDIVVNSVRKSGEETHPFDADIFGYGIDAVDELHALGVNEAQIAEVIRDPGEWDDKEGMFVNVQKKIDQIALSHDVDVEKLALLVEVYKKQSAVERLRVMHIAQTELKNAAIPYVA